MTGTEDPQENGVIANLTVLQKLSYNLVINSSQFINDVEVTKDN